jgi:hypothetical protein
MQRGQTPMFAREIMYTPYFHLQKCNHVGSINDFSSKKRISLIDRVFVRDRPFNLKGGLRFFVSFRIFYLHWVIRAVVLGHIWLLDDYF